MSQFKDMKVVEFNRNQIDASIDFFFLMQAIALSNIVHIVDNGKETGVIILASENESALSAIVDRLGIGN